MDIKVSHCFITVDDHDKALGFYRDVLGLEVANDVSFEGMRWVTLTPPSQPGLQITLETVDSNPGASAEDRRSQSELLAKGLPEELIEADALLDERLILARAFQPRRDAKGQRLDEHRFGRADADVARPAAGPPIGVQRPDHIAAAIANG